MRVCKSIHNQLEKAVRHEYTEEEIRPIDRALLDYDDDLEDTKIRSITMAKRTNGEGSIYYHNGRSRWVGEYITATGTKKTVVGKTQSEVVKG
jgi:hypothetical protein